jgi:PhnB protein
MTRPTTDRGTLPFLYYEDPAAALEWLTLAFGAQERFRLTGPQGGVAHAEIVIGNSVVMIGNVGPRNRARPETVRSGLYVFVDDVESHCRRTRAAGGEIIEEIADQPFGDRTYLARDVEGHEWYFAEHVRDIEIEALQRRLRP